MAQAKTLENQTKHLTGAEITARAAAEEALGIGRGADLSKPPKGVSGSAGTYWRSIVARAADIDLLDNLDREALGIYCQMLARRDRLNRLCDRLTKSAAKTQGEAEDEEGGIDKLESVLAKLATLERNIMTYADKLGMTPQSRVRLAQKRAAAVQDVDADLFGDG